MSIQIMTRTCEFKLVISTHKDPSIQIESFAIANLPSVSTKLN